MSMQLLADGTRSRRYLERYEPRGPMRLERLGQPTQRLYCRQRRIGSAQESEADRTVMTSFDIRRDGRSWAHMWSAPERSRRRHRIEQLARALRDEALHDPIGVDVEAVLLHGGENHPADIIRRRTGLENSVRQCQ
jgi:hypothetical protein